MSDAVTAPVDPIQAAIAQAMAAAAQSVQTAASQVAVQTPANTNVTVAPRPGVPLAMEDMGGSISVDAWLGCSADGFKVGKDKALYAEDLLVEIDLNAVAVCYTIKYGNPAVYAKTYDRVTSARGGSWSDEVTKAQRVDPNAREYPSADIPMRLLGDITIKKEVIHATGTVMGYSLSTTNWNNWKAFYGQCVAAGLRGTTVRARLGVEKRRNAAGNIWGVISFALEPIATAA